MFHSISSIDQRDILVDYKLTPDQEISKLESENSRLAEVINVRNQNLEDNDTQIAAFTAHLKNLIEEIEELREQL